MKKILIIFSSICLSIAAMGQSVKQYEYDNLNRLTKVTYANGAVVQYTYDAVGNRLTKTVAGVYTQYTITVSADPVDGGTVSGGDTYNEGSTCTLTATPNTGYSFVRWTKDGDQVSIDASFSFTVTEDATYVAEFSLNSYNITVAVDPLDGGTVSGAGAYDYGTTCTLTAVANMDYVFVNWTENDEVISSEATYSFMVTDDRNFVANFDISGANGHGYVDLGLPSGLLWATCNVGADTPEGYGDYFAWGETQPKDTYNWSTYQYCNGSSNTLAKYCTNSSYGLNGFTDNQTTLLPEDDAATANWGNDWRMPTKEEWQELYDNTTCTWITRNGVKGRLFTASNGNSIFLPAAGHRSGEELNAVGTDGYCWSSSLDTDVPNNAWGIFYLSYYCGMNCSSRESGRSIRPVYSSLQSLSLSAGWNNISLFIKADDDPIAMLDLLKEGLGDNAEIIEGDEGITSYEVDGEWFGDLNELGVSNERSYMILVTNDCSFVLVGEAANPADYVITINPGWNMIGFPSAVELEIAAALSEFEAEIDDIIEGPDGMTMHEGDGEWFGDIETFVPGQGYLYLSNSNEVKYLVFQTGGSKTRVKAVSPNKTKKPRLGLNDKQ